MACAPRLVMMGILWEECSPKRKVGASYRIVCNLEQNGTCATYFTKCCLF